MTGQGRFHALTCLDEGADRRLRRTRTGPCAREGDSCIGTARFGAKVADRAHPSHAARRGRGPFERRARGCTARPPHTHCEIDAAGPRMWLPVLSPSWRSGGVGHHGPTLFGSEWESPRWQPWSTPRHETPIRVVLIDDSDEIREVLRLALQRGAEFTVVAEAADGRAGLAAVDAHQPHLVLLDIAMPVMDGLQALPLIRQASPGSVVVILTGYPESSIALSAVESELTASSARAARCRSFLPRSARCSTTGCRWPLTSRREKRAVGRRRSKGCRGQQPEGR